MNKQDYITMRNSKQYDLTWFYNYWLKSGGANIDINLFSNIFNQPKLEDILKHLDKKLDLLVLVSAPKLEVDGFGLGFDAGSNFIKCYEK